MYTHYNTRNTILGLNDFSKIKCKILKVNSTLDKWL